MEKYVPDLYQKNMYSIKYENLVRRGIKFLVFDLDNTNEISSISVGAEVRSLCSVNEKYILVGKYMMLIQKY